METFKSAMEVLSNTAIVVVAVGGIVAGLIVWFKYALKTIKYLKETADHGRLFMSRADKLMTEVVPDVLEGFLAKEIVEKRTVKAWRDITTAPYYKASSLRQLTELGESLLVDCGIREFIEDNIDVLKSEIQTKQISDPYRIEDIAFSILRGRLIDEEDAKPPIGAYIYAHPDVSTDAVLMVGAIYLRNLYLKDHPELQQVS